MLGYGSSSAHQYHTKQIKPSWEAQMQNGITKMNCCDLSVSFACQTNISCNAAEMLFLPRKIIGPNNRKKTQQTDHFW